MPAILDDPTSPTIHRVSGAPPYPDPEKPGLPADIVPRQVTLRDRQTVATIVPFASRHQLPASLAAYLCDQLNKEIEGGDTYPMMDPFPPAGFASYWFQNFGAVMLLGVYGNSDDSSSSSSATVVLDENHDWSRECLGSFYIKPNYPGRSSHVCNAGFLVTDAARNRGVGRLMGEAYIDWAPRLGYTYSVFNLVYETNVASCRIWDALGFKRIGRVRGCGNLRSYPGQLVDAIIYGRDMAVPGDGANGGEELVSEERFDKIKFYLKYGKYPNGADRAEKSRLRSAATHYKLLDDDKLMLKDKEVISDPSRQFDIARGVHVQQHGGINKTTATIAERYHWSRIKETVSDVIRTCHHCKELGKAPNSNPVRKAAATTANPPSATTTTNNNTTTVAAAPPLPDNTTVTTTILPQTTTTDDNNNSSTNYDITAVISPDQTGLPSHVAPSSSSPFLHEHHRNPHHNPMLQEDPAYQPIDPQIIAAPPGAHHHHQIHHHHHDNDPDEGAFEAYHAHADFQALLNATEEDGSDAVDRDLEMLIDHQDDDDVDVDVDEAMGGQGGKGRGYYSFVDAPGG